MFCYVTSYRRYPCFRRSCTVILKFIPKMELTGYFKMLESSYKTPRYHILDCQFQLLLHTILISNSERISWRYRYKWVDNTKGYLKDIEGIEIVRYMVLWYVFPNMVINLQVPLKVVNFIISLLFSQCLGTYFCLICGDTTQK